MKLYNDYTYGISTLSPSHNPYHTNSTTITVSCMNSGNISVCGSLTNDHFCISYKNYNLHMQVCHTKEIHLCSLYFLNFIIFICLMML